jgi:uncharacterized protein YcbK (DUF882 family)
LVRRVDLIVRRSLALWVAGWFAVTSSASAHTPPARTARVPTYREMVRLWHTPPTEEPSLTPEGRPPLVLEVIATSERVELYPLREDGGFTSEDLERASHALRDPRTDSESPADEHLLDLAYRIETHFQAKALRIISALRTPRRRHSRHGTGHALDLVVPGARDDEVARYARSLGFVGVGLYTRSGFVHLDVRSRSYFWVDASGPGQRGRIVQVYAKAAAAADAKAVERGEAPPGGSDGEDAEHPDSTSASISSGASTDVRRRSSD